MINEQGVVRSAPECVMHSAEGSGDFHRPPLASIIQRTTYNLWGIANERSPTTCTIVVEVKQIRGDRRATNEAGRGEPNAIATMTMTE
jgi:hypothetical protein